MTTVASSYQRVEHQPWRRGDDGIPWIPVHEDDITGVSEDLTDILASGETVSSVSWESSGVTVSSEANTTTGFTANLTSVGTTKATVTMSTGRKKVYEYRLRGVDTVRKDDYSSSWW